VRPEKRRSALGTVAELRQGMGMDIVHDFVSNILPHKDSGKERKMQGNGDFWRKNRDFWKKVRILGKIALQIQK
jgi:hypothetical protein